MITRWVGRYNAKKNTVTYNYLTFYHAFIVYFWLSSNVCISELTNMIVFLFFSIE